MSHDQPLGKPASVVQLADVRRRLEAEKEDAVAPIRAAFMEEMGALLDEYIEAVRDATADDPDKAIEELMAACSTVLALAAEDHFEELDDQIDFIDTVAEIATELLGDDDGQGELFDDEQDP